MTIEHPNRRQALLAANQDLQSALNRLRDVATPSKSFKAVWHSFWATEEAKAILQSHGFVPCDPIGNPPVVPAGLQWNGPPEPHTDYDSIRDMPGPKEAYRHSKALRVR